MKRKSSDDRTVSSLIWVLLLALKETPRDAIFPSDLLRVLSSYTSTTVCSGIQYLFKHEIIFRALISVFV